MATECFRPKKFRRETLKMIEQANGILSDYFAQGYTMTLRQLHYQFVSRDLYTNTPKNYHKLGIVMSDARLAGLVDWAMMEDRVRELDRSPRWESPSSIIEAVAEQYKEDLWSDQKYRPEVWIEKDALAGIIEKVCRELRIDFFACRGYVSQSAQYDASKRFLNYKRKGQTPIVFHFGDHDPSGIDMSRENADKFELLCGTPIELRRLALNYDQVQEYDPPPNFAKITDSRAAKYIEQYGDQSWELDALEPTVIEGLIRQNIEPLIDRKKWKKLQEKEERNIGLMGKASLNWDEVADFLRDN